MDRRGTILKKDTPIRGKAVDIARACHQSKYIYVAKKGCLSDEGKEEHAR